MGGIRWPVFLLFTSQLTVLNNHFCLLDTTLKTKNTFCLGSKNQVAQKHCTKVFDLPHCGGGGEDVKPIEEIYSNA